MLELQNLSVKSKMSEPVGPPDKPAVSQELHNKVIIDQTMKAIDAQQPQPINNNGTPIAGPRLPLGSSTDIQVPWKRSRRSGCRMFFPSSGRMGFNMIKVADQYPPLEIVRNMIQYETQLRLSDTVQELMDQYCMDEESVR